MDKNLYKKELWSSIDLVASNLYYLDRFRDSREVVEPRYRGAAGIVAIVSAIISFFDVTILIRIASVVTAAMVSIPFLFPVLPKVSDFEKSNKLRLSVSQYLIELEDFWYSEWTEKNYQRYMRSKINFAHTERELASLFGRIDKHILRKAHEDARRYLDKFFTS
jgi:ABC-type transport system involved in cytochrome bd biosynthesis fused ATPase/permease subunit